MSLLIYVVASVLVFAAVPGGASSSSSFFAPLSSASSSSAAFCSFPLPPGFCCFHFFSSARLICLLFFFFALRFGSSVFTAWPCRQLEGVRGWGGGHFLQCAVELALCSWVGCKVGDGEEVLDRQRAGRASRQQGGVGGWAGDGEKGAGRRFARGGSRRRATGRGRRMGGARSACFFFPADGLDSEDRSGSRTWRMGRGWGGGGRPVARKWKEPVTGDWEESADGESPVLHVLFFLGPATVRTRRMGWGRGGGGWPVARRGRDVEPVDGVGSVVGEAAALCSARLSFFFARRLAGLGGWAENREEVPGPRLSGEGRRRRAMWRGQWMGRRALSAVHAFFFVVVVVFLFQFCALVSQDWVHPGRFACTCCSVWTVVF